MKSEQVRVPVEVYSRVVGYFRPVNQWKKKKKEEFKERKVYEFDKRAILANEC
jgi:anaerobic ribonucleoside-triphosphate reductase